MKNDQPILILDLGSGSIKALVGYELSARPVILHTLQSERMVVFRDDKVVNPQILATTLKRMVRDLETHFGFAFEHIEVVIPSLDLEVYHGEKTTNTVDPHGSIHPMDIQNLQSMFQKEFVSGNVTQVCLVPVAYTIDGQKISVNPPIGEITSNILLQAYVQYIHKAFFESIKAVFDMAQIAVKRFVLDGQAVADLLETQQKDRPATYVMLDHGAHVTRLHLISHHKLIRTERIETGSEQLTTLLANRFTLNPDDARRIKERFGYDARSSMFNGLIYAHDGVTIRQEQLNDVIQEFYEPLVEEINHMLEFFNVDQTTQDLRDLPLVMMGGGSQLLGLETLCRYLGKGQGFERPFIKTVGARSLHSLTTLGGLRFAYRYKVIEDDVRRHIQLSRSSSPQKRNFTNYDEE